MLKVSPKIAQHPNGMARRQGPYHLNGMFLSSGSGTVLWLWGGWWKIFKKRLGGHLNSNFAMHKLKSAENTVGEEIRCFFLKKTNCVADISVCSGIC